MIHQINRKMSASKVDGIVVRRGPAARDALRTAIELHASGPRGLVNRDEANMLARQARQRAEHAERKARNGGIGRMQKRAPADSDAASPCRTSRLRRIVPGFYGGVR
jgi:hypothetical protein